MIDVVIYSNEMGEDSLNLNKTSTGIREALSQLGYEHIGLVSIRNKDHYTDEYRRMVTER